MRWQGREGSDNVEDRRGAGGGGGGGRGGGLLGIIVLLVGAYYGVDLSGIVGGVPQIGGSAPVAREQPAQRSAQEQELTQISKVVLRETEKVWSDYFHRHGAHYRMPKMVLYDDRTHTACGTGNASAGPFYCPADQKLYIDLSFYNTMKHELGAEGDAAFAYVLAHEVGHHVQTVLGTIEKVHRAQQRVGKREANALSVRLELQADCYAGLWAHYAQKDGLFEAGDIEEAYNAAEAVGDDRLQQRAQGYTVPHTYTHGTSAQRKQWFQRGLHTGDIEQCDTFK
ncbi:KPN_02809 family neutral zinc metallopeptidase [Conchiformibius kuhniae]|uniref:Neutral zinc metallopeptidase n=1 Tax=Conchiformibius kuhniae TaxID=211502 RepID=A0A8T9MXA9_9NEIS|nr:neutral zinc metallopeptidase [Conchiformibius kuhniae]UOP05056.1 neutral zinc metallopeptidase [Conchiformibius kuhniae]